MVQTVQVEKKVIKELKRNASLQVETMSDETVDALILYDWLQSFFALGNEFASF